MRLVGRVLALVGLVGAASLAAQPSLKVVASVSSLRVYDTITAIATPRDSLGRRVSTARITWLTRPQGAIAIRPDSATRGQRATIDGRQIGVAYAIATWMRSDKRVLRDSVQITVERPAVAQTGVCFISPDSATKYRIDGSKTLDSATAAFIRPWCKQSDTIQLVPVALPPSLLQRKAT